MRAVIVASWDVDTRGSGLDGGMREAWTVLFARERAAGFSLPVAYAAERVSYLEEDVRCHTCHRCHYYLDPDYAPCACSFEEGVSDCGIRRTETLAMTTVSLCPSCSGLPCILFLKSAVPCGPLR